MLDTQAVILQGGGLIPIVLCFPRPFLWGAALGMARGGGDTPGRGIRLGLVTRLMAFTSSNSGMLVNPARGAKHLPAAISGA